MNVLMISVHMHDYETRKVFGGNKKMSICKSRLIIAIHAVEDPW